MDSFFGYILSEYNLSVTVLQRFYDIFYLYAIFSLFSLSLSN